MEQFEPNKNEQSRLQEDLQISEETGVSQDFWNEFVPAYQYLQVIKKFKEKKVSFDKVEEKLSQYRMKRYEKRFSPTLYPDIINEKNREAIEKLDMLVDEFNEMQGVGLEEEKIISIMNTASKLIYGSESETYHL